MSGSMNLIRRRRSNVSTPTPIAISVGTPVPAITVQRSQQINDMASHVVETKSSLQVLLNDKLDYIRRKHLPAVHKDQWKYDER